MKRTERWEVFVYMSECSISLHKYATNWNKADDDSLICISPDHRGHIRMELSLPSEPEPAFPLPPSHPYLQTKYPREYDMRLSGEQGSSRVKNLYAFKERMEGGEDDDDDLSGLSDDDDDDDKDIALRAANKGKGGAGRIGQDGKRKGRRECHLFLYEGGSVGSCPYTELIISSTTGISSQASCPWSVQLSMKRL